MSKFSDRARERLIAQLEADPLLDEETVLSAATLTKVSFITLGLSGIAGFVFAVAFFGDGGLQLILGLLLGYIAYGAYAIYAKPGPRVMGSIAALTSKRVVLLGSTRAGVLEEWKHNQLEDVEQRRKGNLLIMGKIAFKPRKGEPLVMFTSNQGMGRHFVETWQQRWGK